MSACKVCGVPVDLDMGRWCAPHWEMWRASPEHKRQVAWDAEYLFTSDVTEERATHCNRASKIALVDFITRMRAERQNGGKNG